MKMSLLTAATAIAAMAATAQTQLTKYQPGVTTDGAVYFLPKTTIQVSVLVEKSTYTPGDFAPYAGRFLRVMDVDMQSKTAYRVVGIRQTTTCTADTAKGYSVKFNAKTVAANVTLSKDGRLLGINTDEAEDYDTPQAFTPAPRLLPVNPRQFMTEEILACTSTAKMAQLTAREIYDLRENHNLLIKGQADFMPQDGAQMQMMLSRLEEQDQALTSLFCGTTVRDTTEHIITVTPDGPFPRQILFRLSQVCGFTDKDDLSGTPYYISIDDLKTAPPTDEVAAAAKSKKRQPEAGIYVNVPGTMRAVIYDGIEPVSTAEHPAPQFGNVELLSAELFNKRYTTHLLLDPLTGAVSKLDAEPVK